MARPVILGNGSLTVGLNEHGLVHDFYYPYVGLENLTTARSQPHHIGIWVEGMFSWTSDDGWQREVTFSSDALISEITLTNSNLGIALHMQDFVDAHHDVFVRDIEIHNLADKTRQIRVFFHQVFQISREGRADTVMYVPDGPYLLDYKGRCSILAYAETDEGKPFDQYAAGNAGIEGKEGTFRDAEDGELSMSAVEHGGVDSTLRCVVEIAPKASRHVHYWLAVADSQSRLNDIQDNFIGDGLHERLHATQQHWHDWLSQSDAILSSAEEEHRIAARKSLMVIKVHIDNHGGIIASCDSSIYNYGRDYYSYVWPRDGAWVLWPLLKLGYTQEAKRFLRFCGNIMHSDGYLLHKYQPDRAIGSTWHPLVHDRSKELAIQEDETAIVVWLAGEYLRVSEDEEYISNFYASFIRPAAEFMSRFVDAETQLPHASYDLWEEKFLTSTYTTAVTYKSLVVASELATRFGEQIDADRWLAAADMLKARSSKFFDVDERHYIKGYLYKGEKVSIDKVLDISSFYAAWRFNYGEEGHILSSLQQIEQDLLDISPSGGAPRYEHDGYFQSKPAYMGNPWFVTTLWLAQYYAETNNREQAYRLLSWSLDHALSSGVLSEQVNPSNGQVVGVTPLVWSHAELLNAILAIR